MIKNKVIYRIQILSILCITNIAVCYEQDPFPKSQISLDALEPYMDEVHAEIKKEFSYQHDERTHRDTREYGYSFFKMKNGDFNLTPIPGFLQDIGSLVCQSLGHSKQIFTNIILSLYKEGFHLEPHVDSHATHRYSEKFYFEENVYGIIIEPDEDGHLYFVLDGENFSPRSGLDSFYELEEKVGSTFCLQGKFRIKPYFHGVSKVKKRRISITFRTVIFE